MPVLSETLDEHVTHEFGYFLKLQRTLRPVPLRHPIDGSEDREAGKLDIGALEFARRHAGFDDRPHAALELIAPADVTRALLLVEAVEIRLQQATESLSGDRLDVPLE